MMARLPFLRRASASLALAALSATATAQPSFTFSTARRGAVIGPLHHGLFYEEINHGGDGGLYAGLIRNRSFEDNAQAADCWWPLGPVAFEGVSTCRPSTYTLHTRPTAAAPRGAPQLRAVLQRVGPRAAAFHGDAQPEAHRVCRRTG